MANSDIFLPHVAPATPRRATREEKIGVAISMIAMFGAVLVLLFYGLNGVGQSPAEGDDSVYIFTGGAPDRTQETVEAATPAVVDDDYVVGDFGDPVTDLYAEDDDGGWGAAALGRGDGDGRNASRADRPRRGNITRGRGPPRD